ncbi:hypothetical protein QFZ81_006418 [Paenibacillus sp. V4I9]|uniref:hypothetical protein n=1 Tax=Paenibacillus sp. V4I9 TaxID=3042308 RepID=UPI00278AC597|nr:hypothetical protein [Paenibacillus sp. V4I9]MDQ0891330.1 hypothetical protein [Paenibacillus sp. V4I9]
MHAAVTEKLIYGKGIRTNNQNTDKILSLWEEFLRLKLKGDIYAVYNNYSSDFTGVTICILVLKRNLRMKAVS